MMRLDVYLCERGLCSSRTEAKGFITSGAVSVDGKVISKPSFQLDPELQYDLDLDTEKKRYVSRGGYKLEAALDNFNLDASGRRAIDIGASSGGFTDCLLKRGALSVIAVDSGHSQLVESLRLDERVICIEKFNARFMTPESLSYVPDLAVMDVSFISATLIIPAVYRCLEPGGDFVLLIKPQFEVGRGNIDKGGIVKNASLRNKAKDDVLSFCVSCGFKVMGSMESPIVGGDGNIEFLAHLKK